VTYRRSAREWIESTPLVLILTLAALPVFMLAGRFAARPSADFKSLAPSLQFAIGGAAFGTALGAGVGALAGTLRIPGGRLMSIASVGLIAAPPAFWWLGLTRVAPFGFLTNRYVAMAVAGTANAPVAVLLVTAAVREISTSSYEAARVALGPFRRITFVLLPLLRSAVLAAFLLTVILLLGESEMPFLFGFRTSMTDVVTAFARTFTVDDVMPSLVPLLLTVIAIGIGLVKPMFSVLLSRSSAGQGIVQKRTSVWLALPLLISPAAMALSLAGYASTAFSAGGSARAPVDWPTTLASVLEPVFCALVSVFVGSLASYWTRTSTLIRPLAAVGLIVFCVPAAISAIGWIAIGQILGGIAIPLAAAHLSRTIGLSVLAFVVGYSRLPRSLDDAAQLVPISALRRWWTITLPLVIPSLAAASALTAALAFADRDAASLLLPPGGTRLMLNLYLLSANARAATIGVTALEVFLAGAIVIALAASAPLLLRVNRRG
jgi:iron(III) transport system permease protein